MKEQFIEEMRKDYTKFGIDDGWNLTTWIDDINDLPVETAKVCSYSKDMPEYRFL